VAKEVLCMDMTGEGTRSQELQDQGCGSGDVVIEDKLYYYSGSCPVPLRLY
jgi:hypothetical protein